MWEDALHAFGLVVVDSTWLVGGGLIFDLREHKDDTYL